MKVTITFTLDEYMLSAVNAFIKQNRAIDKDISRPYDDAVTEDDVKEFIASAVDNSLENYAEQISEIEADYAAARKEREP